MLTGSRISQHIHHYHHTHLGLGLAFGCGLGFCYCRTVQFSSKRAPSPSVAAVSRNRSSNFMSASSSIDFGLPLAACLQPKSPSSEIPVLSDCFSQQEDDRERPLEGLASVIEFPKYLGLLPKNGKSIFYEAWKDDQTKRIAITGDFKYYRNLCPVFNYLFLNALVIEWIEGGIVALGKFDALHIGHRELAIQAAKVGVPFLLSFVGMAEVFGWEPRAPIVAKCDRKRVLSSWAPYCDNKIPAEYQVEFSKVRHLTPRQFVEKLSKEFGVRGVVAGENYRFGFKAAGDAAELVRLCEEYGLTAYVINSVMDQNQDSKNIGSNDSKEQGQVSSTRVRHALAKGDMIYVSELLGRQHRLMLLVKDQGWLINNQRKVSARKSCLLNLPPKDGLYERCSLFTGSENVVPCRVIIDETHIHLELDDVATCVSIISHDFRSLGIEFGELAV